MPYHHIPVMTREVVHYLNCESGKIYVDCTLGGSGHSMAILNRILPNGVLIGIDQDKDAIRNANTVLMPYTSNIHLFHDNFINLAEILSSLNISSVNGILLDLGVSLHQIESSGRGFSFTRDEPLDMRMNPESGTTAENLINRLEEKALSKLLKDYGEEPRARQIARGIVKKRKQGAIKSSRQLAQVVIDTLPKRSSSRQKRIHPATRVFMALRIAVNKELDCLAAFMENAVTFLKTGGRLCVISFHSLEDRIVKHRIKAFEKACVCPPDFPKCICDKKRTGRSLTKKIIRPTAKEIERNPMARSARLRVLEKIA
ncbi:MAG: 16S rRNA (cytosine(1402)-N(4))-methyltransferase RsmH [Deltaproteobacteria bacterium]|nr:16S rRNA (cytosine(1402)-N(4))-methyltransferase RsmH [Deltaproteobacteria bacterium]